MSVSHLRYPRSATLHLKAILLIALAVYAARDLAPLASYGGRPLDAEGPLLWATIGLLLVTSIIIPLITPGTHIPVKPEVCTNGPVAVRSLNRFQGAIARQSRAEGVYPLGPDVHLPRSHCISGAAENDDHRRRPPAYLGHGRCGIFEGADLRGKPRDFVHSRVTHTIPQTLDVLNGRRKRHIFFGLAKVFRLEYSLLVLSLVIQVFANFAAPVGVNRIL